MLSALYGKRFDCHGLIEGAGIFYVPDLATYSRASGPGLPFNSHAARTSFPVKLALSEAKSVENWLFPSLDDARTRQIQTACEFYSRALQNAEQDAEVAYLHLITGTTKNLGVRRPDRGQWSRWLRIERGRAWLRSCSALVPFPDGDARMMEKGCRACTLNPALKLPAFSRIRGPARRVVTRKRNPISESTTHYPSRRAELDGQSTGFDFRGNAGGQRLR